MTTGVPIYLVSACSSGEEFVAAFRRYADRNGLFIPIADPIAQGQRGRFAVTLADGGVMVEGDAEVVSSAKTPSVLHGRVGMTIRFVEPDERSRTVLVELEKARLSMRPPAPTVPPRPAELPPGPRAVPPRPAGRIDANNALAECVALGELGALEAIDRSASASGSMPKAGPKFVVPTIPPVSIPRTRTPSSPLPLARERARTPSPAPVIPSRPQTLPATVAPPASPPAMSRTMTMASTAPPPPIAPTAIDDELALPTSIDQGAVRPARAASDTDSEQLATGAPVELLDTHDTISMLDLEPDPDSPTMTRPPVEATSRAREDATSPAPPSTTRPAPSTQPPPLPRTVTPLPPPRTPTPARPMPVASPPRKTPGSVPIVSPIASRQELAPGIAARASVSTPPPMPVVRTPTEDPNPTPVTMMAAVPSAPIVAEHSEPRGRRAISDLEINEPTDLTEIPDAPFTDVDNASLSDEPVEEDVVQHVDEALGRERKKTRMGVVVVPEGMAVLPAAPSAPVVASPPPKPAPQPPQIEEPTPSGDWMMTPGADGPTIAPRTTPVPKATPTSLPTGDWTIELNAESPDGWTPPAKLDAPVEAPAPARVPRAATPVPIEAKRRATTEPPIGPPVSAVASSYPLESEPRRDSQPLLVAEPKVQIDPTLIEPLQAMPALDGPALAGSSGHLPAASSGNLGMAAMPVEAAPAMAMMMTPVPGSAAYPPAGMPQARAGSGPMPRTGTGPMPRLVADAGSGVVRENQELRRVTGPHGAIEDRKRRVKVIAISAAAAVLVGIVFVIVFTMGGDDPSPANGSDRAIVNDHVTTPAPDAAHAVDVTPVDAAAEVASPATADAGAVAPPRGPCFADLASIPPGAEIVQDRTTVIGMTPAKLTLPCGVEVKLTFRKARFGSVDRKVTPTEAGAKVKVTLSKPTFSVKVSSTPPGATITVAGKNVGITPTTVRLTAFEVSTLTIARDGYATELQRITPKTNNQTVHANLKKAPRKGR